RAPPRLPQGTPPVTRRTAGYPGGSGGRSARSGGDPGAQTGDPGDLLVTRGGQAVTRAVKRDPGGQVLAAVGSLRSGAPASDQQRTMSRMDSRPVTSSPSTTTRWRNPARTMVAAA